MMYLARAIHFDESDQNVFANPARTGEWCISGGFEFSNWVEDDLTGKQRQAFANGWLGLGTSGRVTFVAVTQIEEAELEELTDVLAQHFVDFYGAPDLASARPVDLRAPMVLKLATFAWCSRVSSASLATCFQIANHAGVRLSNFSDLKTNHARLTSMKHTMFGWPPMPRMDNTRRNRLVPSAMPNQYGWPATQRTHNCPTH